MRSMSYLIWRIEVIISSKNDRQPGLCGGAALLLDWTHSKAVVGREMMKHKEVDDGNDPITVKSATGMYNDCLPQSPQK